VFIKWYRERLRTTLTGTILATLHFVVVLAVIVLIAFWPSRDWPWWGLLPFVLDFPFSYCIERAVRVTVAIVLWLPHGTLEKFLLARREPLSSLNLFWVPAVEYLALGTMWHYFWPRLLRMAVRIIGRSRGQ
jgi:hypothetical protein